jgi:putative ABC transport system permease protein
MIRNYFKVALRMFLKNKVFVSINVLGLGAALTCSIIAYLNWEFNHRFDRFNTKADRIYKINSISLVNNQPLPFGITPLPLGPAVENQVSGVENAVRYVETFANLKRESDFFNSRIGYVDPDFGEMFTVDLIAGNAQALRDKSQVLISERIAQILFPGKDAIGQLLTVAYAQKGERNYFIGGVFRKLPLNSSFRFDVLASFDDFLELSAARDQDWAVMVPATFLLLRDKNQLKQIATELNQYVATQNKAREDLQVKQFYLQPLLSMSHESVNVRGHIFQSSLPASAINSPIIMALLMLLLACFNFTNTAVAMASSRLKEIGLRKVFGGTRDKVVYQFFAENIIICLSALVVAVILAWFFVPAYSSLWSFLDLKLDFIKNWEIIPMMIVILLLTGIFAGVYPALYISSFEPVNIFSKKLKFLGTNAFMRVLLIFQLGISIVAIIAGIVFAQNAQYQETLNMGYSHDQTFIVQVNNEKEFRTFRDVLAQNPAIKQISGSAGHIGLGSYQRSVKSNTTQAFVEGFDIGHNFLSVCDLTLLKGRNFEENSERDLRESVIVTEQLARQFGWSDPIGQKMIISDTIVTYVVGMVKDIYMRGLFEPVKPLFLRMSPETEYKYITVKVAAENFVPIRHTIEDLWKRNFPGLQFKGFAQDEILYEAKSINKNIRTVFTYLAIIAVFLSISGLFSMISLHIIKHSREYGIRKVMGASVLNITYNISKEFIVLIVLSAIVGSVIAAWFVSWLLSSIYVYHVGLNAFAFLLANAIIVAISALAVGAKVVKAATANPVKTLVEL